MDFVFSKVNVFNSIISPTFEMAWAGYEESTKLGRMLQCVSILTYSTKLVNVKQHKFTFPALNWRAPPGAVTLNVIPLVTLGLDWFAHLIKQKNE